MIPYTHFFALVLALVVGAVKGYVDASIIMGGGKIRHGLHFAVWAVLLIAVVAGYAWGRPLDWQTLGGTVLSVWGLSALMFRGTVGTIPGWEWDHMGTTAKLDRLLGDWFGEEAGRAALAAEWFLFVGGLIWYWVA